MRNVKVQAVFGRARGLFDGFTAGQRTVTAIAVLVAIVGGAVFLNWASKPAMAPLFVGLSSADASAVTTKLAEGGTPYELADGGRTVLVPRTDIDQKRIDLAGQGLPAGGSNGEGYGLLDKLSLTSSDFQQKLTAKRAYEGELKKAIEKIDSVQEATVQLALPEQDVFTSEQTKPSASVLVKNRPTASLSSGQVEAVVHLVSSAVPKLEAGQVTVTDSAGKLLNAPGAAGAGSGAADARVAQAQSVSAGLTKKIQAMLDTAVGPGNASVSVQADLDFDNTKVNRKNYVQGKPNDLPLAQEKTSEKMDGTSPNAVGGVLGPDNITVPNGTNGSKQKYEKTTEKTNNAIGTEETEVTKATGTIRKLGIAVILNSKTTAGANVAQIQKLVTAAANADATRGDVVEVSKMAFDTQAAEEAARQAEEAASKQRMDELLGLAKNVLLGLLLLAALLIGYKKSRRRPTTIELGELPSAGQPALPAVPEPTPLEYQLEDEMAVRALEATPVDPQGEARVVARAEIGELVKDNPDEVARLLRGWIAERS